MSILSLFLVTVDTKNKDRIGISPTYYHNRSRIVYRHIYLYLPANIKNGTNIPPKLPQNEPTPVDVLRTSVGEISEAITYTKSKAVEIAVLPSSTRMVTTTVFTVK